MSLVKAGQIANCCQPNALMTLKEYLMDYALEDTREKGEEVIKAEINKILSDKVKNIAIKNIEELEKGKRDFRF